MNATLFLFTIVSTGAVYGMKESEPNVIKNNISSEAASLNNPSKKETEKCYPLWLTEETQITFTVKKLPPVLPDGFMPFFIPIDLEKNKAVIEIALKDHLDSQK